MKIAFEKITAFKVKGKTKEFTFLHVSSWNGLQEWRATTGEGLIVATAGSAAETRPFGGFSEAFGDIFGAHFGRPGASEVAVVLASPDLCEELSLVAGPQAESQEQAT